jgi:hypothetical protein
VACIRDSMNREICRLPGDLQDGSQQLGDHSAPAIDASAGDETTQRNGDREEAEASVREDVSANNEAAVSDVGTENDVPSVVDVVSGEGEAAVIDVGTGDGDATTMDVVTGEADAAVIEAASGDGDAAAVDGGTAGSCYSASAGAMPGDPPAQSCTDVVPSITHSGHYPFAFAGAQANVTLACGNNYPNRRDVIYKLDLSSRRDVSVKLTHSGPTSSVVGLTNQCLNSPTALVCGDTQGTMGPGTYYIVAETYDDGDGALDVTVHQPAALSVFQSCDATVGGSEVQCPIEVPGTYREPDGSLGVTFQSAAIAAAACVGAPIHSIVSAFRLNAPAQATIDSTLDGHVSALVGGVALRSDCSGSTDLGCYEGGGLFTRRLDPGTYYLVVSSAQYIDYRFPGGTKVEASPVASLTLEDVPGPPANVTCDTATTFTNYQTEPRVIGGPVDPKDSTHRLRYHKIDTSGTFSVRLWVGGAIPTNGLTVSLRSDCANEASQIMSSGYDLNNQVRVGLSGAPAGTYYLVVSSVEGALYEFTP